jgi:hypothetical protein
MRSLALGLALAALLGVWATPAMGDTVPLPPDAATGSSASFALLGVACPSAGSCVAVGYYLDTSSFREGLIETENNGVWTASKVNLTQLPAGARDPILDSVTCSAAGSCVAVGDYGDAGAHQQGLIETYSAGTWTASTLSLAGLPSTATDPVVAATSVACADAQDCVGVGRYYDGSSDQQGMIFTLRGGTWTAQELSLSGLEPYADPFVQLPQVSCPSAGNCVAVGSYEDAAQIRQGLTATEVGGVWFSDRLDLSRLPGNPTGASLSSVSCPSAGSCSALGSDITSAGDQPATVSQTGSLWAPAAALALPTNGAAQGGDGSSISCASPGDCTALGVYADPSLYSSGAEFSETNGSWTQALETGVPAGAAADPQLVLRSVACVSAGNCVGVGNYQATDGNDDALIVRQSSGAFTTASSELTTTHTVNDNGNEQSDVACAADGYCVAVGYTLDAHSLNTAGFLLAAPAAVQAPTASVAGNQATVSWSAPSADGGIALSGYALKANDLTSPARGGQTLAVGASIRSATFASLDPGDSYTFTISATGPLGAGIAATTPRVAVVAAAATPPDTTSAPAPAPPTKTQLLASLARLLAPTGTTSRIRSLRRSHAYTFTYEPLESGRVTVRWYEITGRGKHRKLHLVASGSATTHATGAVKVHVKLTALGRRLVRSAKRLRLSATVTFTGGGMTVSRTHTFALH